MTLTRRDGPCRVFSTTGVTTQQRFSRADTVEGRSVKCPERNGEKFRKVGGSVSMNSVARPWPSVHLCFPETQTRGRGKRLEEGVGDLGGSDAGISTKMRPTPVPRWHILN